MERGGVGGIKNYLLIDRKNTKKTRGNQPKGIYNHEH